MQQAAKRRKHNGSVDLPTTDKAPLTIDPLCLLPAARCLLHQVLLERSPVVLGPAFGDALMVVVGDVDVGEVDAAAFGGVGEPEGEDGVRIIILPVGSAPALDDEFAGDCVEHFAREHAVEGGEGGAGFGADLHLPAGESGVLFRVHVKLIQLGSGGGEANALDDRFGHDSVGRRQYAAGS